MIGGFGRRLARYYDYFMPARTPEQRAADEKAEEREVRRRRLRQLIRRSTKREP